MNHETLRAAYAELLARSGGDLRRTACPEGEALQRALAAEGPEADRLAVVNHAMACPVCLREFELLRALQHAAPARRMAPAWLGLAAAAVVLLGVGAVLSWRSVGKDDVVRGAGPIALVQPTPGAEVTAPVVLAWRPVAGAQRYEVVVLGPAGDILVRRQTDDTIVALPGALPPGARLLWHVTARLGLADSVRSEPGSFSVAPP
jgi:hypothetical protein